MSVTAKKTRIENPRMLIHNLFYNQTDLFDQEKHLKFESDFGKNTWIWSKLFSQFRKPHKFYEKVFRTN